MNIKERIKFVILGNTYDDINKCYWVICSKHGLTKGHKHGFHNAVDCKKCIMEDMKDD